MNQQVFISYSNESHIDRQVADTIYDTLKARGIVISPGKFVNLKGRVPSAFQNML